MDVWMVLGVCVYLVAIEGACGADVVILWLGIGTVGL